MITRKQWIDYCDTVNRTMNTYDVFVHGAKVVQVIFYEDGVAVQPKIVTEELLRNPPIRTIYMYPDSFKSTKKNKELYYKTKVKTKPENIINTNLTKFYKTS